MMWHGICSKIPFLFIRTGSFAHACPLASLLFKLVLLAHEIKNHILDVDSRISPPTS